MSIRREKKRRSAQRQRMIQFSMTPEGPERVALLIQWARIIVTEVSDEVLSKKRRQHESARDSWRGLAGFGRCGACGRPGARFWHHIVQLKNGGPSVSRRNLVRICAECHSQVHTHLAVPEMTDEGLYREANKIAASPAKAMAPRLIRNPRLRDATDNR